MPEVHEAMEAEARERLRAVISLEDQERLGVQIVLRHRPGRRRGGPLRQRARHRPGDRAGPAAATARRRSRTRSSSGAGARCSSCGDSERAAARRLRERMVSDGRRGGRDPLVLARSARHHAARHVPRPVAPGARVRRGRFEVAIDRGFRGRHARVRRGRARARRTPAPGSARRSSRATARCTRAGCAHSVEAWQDGTLVGGLYGVALGGAFFGESMFHRVTDASKVALVALVERLRDARLRAARHAVGDAAPRAVRRRSRFRRPDYLRRLRARRCELEVAIVCVTLPRSPSVDGVGLAQRERRDRHVELLAASGDHLVGAFHIAERRRSGQPDV